MDFGLQASIDDDNTAVWYTEVTTAKYHVGTPHSKSTTSTINMGKRQYEEMAKRAKLAQEQMQQQSQQSKQTLKSGKTGTTVASSGSTTGSSRDSGSQMTYHLCKHCPQCKHPLNGLQKYGWPRLRSNSLS